MLDSRSRRMHLTRWPRLQRREAIVELGGTSPIRSGRMSRGYARGFCNGRVPPQQGRVPDRLRSPERENSTSASTSVKV
eukprot:10383252-Heterocapsa_arctica.AAC.1